MGAVCRISSCYKNHDSFSVNEMNSSTPSRSGRRSKTGSDENAAVCSAFQFSRSAFAVIIGLSELRMVFRLWLKAVFTTALNRLSSQPRSVRLFLVSLITADFT